MLEKREPTPQETGMCPHGNFPDSCVICTTETNKKTKFFATETGLWVDTPENRAAFDAISAEAKKMDFGDIDKYLSFRELYNKRLKAVRDAEEDVDYQIEERGDTEDWAEKKLERARQEAKVVNDVFGSIRNGRELNPDQINFLLKETKEEIKQIDHDYEANRLGMMPKKFNIEENRARRQKLQALELFLERQINSSGHKT